MALVMLIEFIDSKINLKSFASFRNLFQKLFQNLFGENEVFVGYFILKLNLKYFENYRHLKTFLILPFSLC